jgi:hypothetical protein
VFIFWRAVTNNVVIGTFGWNFEKGCNFRIPAFFNINFGFLVEN